MPNPTPVPQTTVQTQTQTKTRTSTKVLLAFLAIASVAAAAAGFIISANAQPILVVKAIAQPASHSVTVGAASDAVLGVSLQAQNKPINVNRLTFTIKANYTGSISSHISQCALKDLQGVSVGQSGVVDNTGQVVVSSLGITVPKNVGKGYRLHCSFTNIPPDGSNPDIYSWSIKNDAAVGASSNNVPIPATRINVGGPADPGVNTSGAIAVTVSSGSTTQTGAGSLTFALASTPSSTTTVDGTRDVSVLGLTATAGNASDVIVKQIKLSAYGDDQANVSMTAGGEANSDINDYVMSCSLYEGATRLSGPATPGADGQTILFDYSAISWAIPHGTTKLLTVKCDFANTTTAGNAYFAFDIEDAASDVLVVDGNSVAFPATGSDLNGNLPNGAATRLITLSDSGSLSVSIGSDTPSADFILSSTSNNQVATYRFTATNEAFNVQTLEFTEEQAEDDTGTADSSVYTNNVTVVTINYPKTDGSTATATSSMSGNMARFSGLSMYVPVGAPKDVKVYVNTPATDRNSGGSATSNEKIRLAFSDGDNSGAESFKATGAGSGFTIDETAPSIVDIGDDAYSIDGVAPFVVRETKPIITLSASAPSGSSVVGRGEVIRVNVAASSNEDVVMNQLMFKIASTDNANSGWNKCGANATGGTNISDLDLYNLTTNGTSNALDAGSTWTMYTDSGTACDTVASQVGFAKIVFGTPEVIPHGSTYTYALYFDSTGASSSQDDSIRFDLPTDPIVTTYLPGGVISDTTLGRTDSTITTLQPNSVSVGDVVCFAGANTVCDTLEEHALVTAASGNDVTLARGYLGTNIQQQVNGQNIMRLPGSLLWQDDGIPATSTSYQEYWGSYLVDNLTVSGGTLVY